MNVDKRILKSPPFMKRVNKSSKMAEAITPALMKMEKLMIRMTTN